MRWRTQVPIAMHRTQVLAPVIHHMKPNGKSERACSLATENLLLLELSRVYLEGVNLDRTEAVL